MNDSLAFITALNNKDLASLASIPKSDLHNHSSRGGNLNDFNAYTSKNIKSPANFDSLAEMQLWYDQNIKPNIDPNKLLELAFMQVNRDSIKLLHMSFGLNNVINYQNYFNQIIDLKNKFAPDTILIPELRIGRDKDVYEVEKLFEEILTYNFFKSIDLSGEDSFSVKPFQNIFKKAKQNGFILKAHLGEYGDAESVLEAVEALELDQVQHGISISSSQNVMSEISKRNVQLNICPTSNVKLKRVKDYQSHPIKKLFDNGIKVTINTDDMLIYDSSVSEEYLQLYQAKLFSAEELNKIRIQGLDKVNIN
ncbi:MAG: adenosine deaminase [bacterium]